MMSRKKSGYEVGYGKPPVHTRFQKGKSGNPSGRRARQLSFDELMVRELGKKITITENGESRRITKQDAIVKRCVQKAMQGDSGAQKQVRESLSRLAMSLPTYETIKVTLKLEEDDDTPKEHW
jgi:ribosomal protein L16/L10AE